MKNISVFIIAQDEEKRLPATLAAARKVSDDIVVVDSGSTDRTIEVAQSFGARTAYHPWETICIQKHFAQELCREKWVLSLDADEELGPELIEEINQWRAEPEDGAKALRIRIADVFPGQRRPARFAKCYNLYRLYHRDFVDMPKDAGTSDRVVFKQSTCCVRQLKNRVHHHSYICLVQLVNKANRYSSEAAEHSLMRGRNYGIGRLLVDFPVQLFRFYFLNRMFLYGRLGLLVAINGAYFQTMKVMKFLEKKWLVQVKDGNACR